MFSSEGGIFPPIKNFSVACGRGVLLICQVLGVLGLVVYLSYTQELITAFKHYGENTVIDAHLTEQKESKLLSSKWIKLFPHIQHLVAAIESNPGDLEYQYTTSAEYSTVSLLSNRLMVGGEISSVIQARDHRNLPKTYGGDFFIVTLRREGRAGDGVSCEVDDRMNGLYDVTCILPWSGDARLSVILVNPSESVYQLIKTYSSVTEHGVIINTTLLGPGKRKEYTRCSIGFPDMREEQLCDYSNPTHGEPWQCIRPESGQCSEIIWQEKHVREYGRKFYDSMYFQEGVNHEVEIKGSGVTVRVLEPALEERSGAREDSPYSAANSHLSTTKPEKPTGWFFNGKWTSISTQSKEYSHELLRTCLRDKEIYFIGDSTTRHWFRLLVRVLRPREWGPDNTKVWSIWRDASSKLLNLTLHYRSHGPPLHNPGPPESRPYVTNTLDNITTGGEGTIIFFNIGFHFERYTADAFGDRLAKVKESLESLLSRLPGVRVFVRGMHTHDFEPLCPAAWLSYRYDVMLRNNFVNMRGVTFLDMWGFSVLLNNRPLHPDMDILQKQVGLFLSHLC